MGSKYPFAMVSLTGWYKVASSVHIRKDVGNMEKLNKTRPTKDNYYLDIALAVSKRSTCLKRHYGAVIVKDDKIIATGYNGSPKGQANCCDVGKCYRENAPMGHGYEDCPAVHAEMNALLQANGHEVQGATLYLACEDMQEQLLLKEFIEENPEPCTLCKRMLLNSEISRVVNRSGDISWD